MDVIWCKQALDQVICKDTTHDYVHFEIPICMKKTNINALGGKIE
jgi:hypothetical protein